MALARYHSSQIGALLWISSIQYFIIQVIVASMWTTTYSLSQNTISALGNTSSGTCLKNIICSPGHNLMNLSFATLGITMILGTLLMNWQSKPGTGKIIGFTCLLLAGLGTLLVGLYPENTISTLHIIGAALPFVFGNLGMIVLGHTFTSLPKNWRLYTLLSGVIGLAALMLLITENYLGLGVGGMERLTAYPQTIWMIAFGAYVLKHRSSVFD